MLGDFVTPYHRPLYAAHGVVATIEIADTFPFLLFNSTYDHNIHYSQVWNNFDGVNSIIYGSLSKHWGYPILRAAEEAILRAAEEGFPAVTPNNITGYYDQGNKPLILSSVYKPAKTIYMELPSLIHIVILSSLYLIYLFLKLAKIDI
jgi:hypothetical protein